MNLPLTIRALNPEIPLKKHSATIHIEASLGVVDHKLLNIIYKCAFDTDKCSSDYYYLKFNDIKDFLGWKRFVMADICESLEKLRIAKISWNIFGQDNKNTQKWVAAGSTGFIASYLTISEHCAIRFSLSPEIKRLISNPNIYSYIDLRVQKKLKSKYELILYEVLIDELNRSGQNNIVTRWFSISDLRRLYGLPYDAYSEAKDFNKFCLKDPIESINLNTDLEVKINDEERVKRRIVAVRFSVIMKKGSSSDLDNLQTTLDFATEQNEQDKQYYAIEELSQLFNSEKAAQQIIEYVKEKYPSYDCEELIKENIEYAKRDKSKKQVYSFLGYTRSAIENDYAGYIKRYDVQNKNDNNLKINTEESNEDKNKNDNLEIEWEKNLNEFNALPENIKLKYFGLAETQNTFLKTIKNNSQQKILSTVSVYIENKSLFKNDII